METPVPSPKAVTSLLREWSAGNKQALDRLIPLVYDELRRVAHVQLRKESHARTLQPTALVHELYARFAEGEGLSLTDRAHFLAVAARNMRQIMMDQARRRNAGKRGGGEEKLSLDEVLAAGLERPSILVALDDALAALERQDPALAQLIELRYFGGLTAEESGVVLSKTAREVERDLALAKAWLRRYVGA